MRRIVFYLLAAGVFLGGSWFYFNHDHLVGAVQQYVENAELMTLEAKFNPEQIMEVNRKDLLPTAQHGFRDVVLKLHPHLFMEVKYTQADKKTKEGVLFWSLVDGEMVVNADTWEKTHGFEDALNADASRTDFKLMNALAKTKGIANVDQLQKELHIEKEVLQGWIQRAASKHLVVQKGNEVQLHFQDPKILVSPETQIKHSLVTKSYDQAPRLSKKYSSRQVQKLAQAAFGDDFKVRGMAEVFLPVYHIEVLNPDGSVRTSYWNALTGQKIQPRYFK